MYRSLYAFRSAEPNSLHFAAGESFLILERSNKHWWLGSRCSSGETGYIPASYIEKIQVNNTLWRGLCLLLWSRLALTDEVESREAAVSWGLTWCDRERQIQWKCTLCTAVRTMLKLTADYCHTREECTITEEAWNYRKGCMMYGLLHCSRSLRQGGGLSSGMIQNKIWDRTQTGDKGHGAQR